MLVSKFFPTHSSPNSTEPVVANWRELQVHFMSPLSNPRSEGGHQIAQSPIAGIDQDS